MKNALKNFIQQFCVRVWGLKSVARNNEFTLDSLEEGTARKKGDSWERHKVEFNWRILMLKKGDSKKWMKTWKKGCINVTWKQKLKQKLAKLKTEKY